MLLIITCINLRMQKYSYFLHLQNNIEVFSIFFFGTIIDTKNSCREKPVRNEAFCQNVIDRQSCIGRWQ